LDLGAEDRSGTRPRELLRFEDTAGVLVGEGRLVQRVLAVPTLLAGVVYVAGRMWPERVAAGVLAVPVLYAFAVAAGGLVAYLLYARASVLDDNRLRWLGAGFALAAVAMLAQGFTLSGFAVHDVFGTTPSGSGRLYLIWHAALPTFVAGALWAGRGGSARWRHWLTVGFGVSIGAAVWDLPLPPVPELVTGEGTFTPMYRGATAMLLASAAVVSVLLVVVVLRHPSCPQAWVAVGLVLLVGDLGLTVGAGSLFDAAWWASTPFRAAQFLVPAMGLLTEFVGTFRTLRRHERGLAERLAQELHLAALHAGADERPVDPAVCRRIRDVLAAGGPDMVLQPVYELASGRIVGAEALARFATEPRQGPDVWFAEAAACGLGRELELAAVNAALRMLPDLPPGVDLSVNVSPDLLVDERLARALADVDAYRVVVEVTEHAAVADYRRLTGAVARLRSQGVRLAVDDAGAGFASLRHILRLSPDIMKLDITLTRDIHIDPVRQSLAESLVAFADQTGIRIVAEGVEGQQELTKLKELGVHYAQGFHLARPAPPPLVDQTAPQLIARAPYPRT